MKREFSSHLRRSPYGRNNRWLPSASSCVLDGVADDTSGGVQADWVGDRDTKWRNRSLAEFLDGEEFLQNGDLAETGEDGGDGVVLDSWSWGREDEGEHKK